jgi:hypothetical protein
MMGQKIVEPKLYYAQGGAQKATQEMCCMSPKDPGGLFGRTSSLGPPSSHPGQAQPGLGDLQDGGHLRLLPRRQLARQEFLRSPARLLRGLLADLLGTLRDIGKHGHAVRKDLQEAAPDEQLRLLGAIPDQQGPWLQRGQKRGVPGQDAEVAVPAPAQ